MMKTSAEDLAIAVPMSCGLLCCVAVPCTFSSLFRHHASARTSCRSAPQPLQLSQNGTVA